MARRPPRSPRLAGIVVLALSAAELACQGKAQREAPRVTTDGGPVADIEGVTLDGDRFRLADHRGQVVLLNFWATWCKPCRDELPELARLHTAHADAGLIVVGINVDVARLRNKVANMTRRFSLPFPVVLDPTNRWVPPMEVVGYPTSFLVGRDGTLRWRRDGLILEHDEELARAIGEAVADPIAESGAPTG